jgi:DNA-binding MarR family transcriptional regulator
MSAPQQAFVLLERAAARLMDEVAALLKQHGLTAPQYNVLRNLRGAKGQPLSCTEIAARMIQRDPDITRLLDRMEQRGLIRRERRPEDRRLVLAAVTPAGLNTLAALDRPMQDLHRRQFRALSKAQTAQLAALLNRIAEPSHPTP